MRLRATTLLLAIISLSMPQLQAADEIAVVTAQQGYLLDENDVVVDAVPAQQVFRVKSRQGDYLVVDHNGVEVRLHNRLCHLSSTWVFVTPQNADAVFQSLRLVQQATRAQNLEHYDRAIDLMNQAVQAIEDPAADALELRSWILPSLAYLYYLQENNDQANATLDRCDADIQKFGQQKDMVAAELLNTRGLLRAAVEENDEAVELHKRALEIAAAAAGEDHVNCVILQGNLSSAYEVVGDYENAIARQLQSRNALRPIVPSSAAELVVSQLRLADLYRDNEQYEDALPAYENSLRNMVVYHSHLLIDIANTRSNLAYTNRMLGNYEASEKNCRDLLQLLRRLEPADENSYRKDTHNRLGLIDFDQEDYKAALAHFLDAAELADAENYTSDDGITYENIGDAMMNLERTEDARATYELAVDIYIETEGEDSENLVTVRESLAAISSSRDGSLNDVVMVAEPQGYLQDDDGKTIAVVPGLTVLNWFSVGAEFHEVEYQGEIGRLSNTQLHSKTQLPGYNTVKAEDLKNIAQTIAKYLLAFRASDADASASAIQSARLLAEKQEVSDTSLDMWVQLMGLALKSKSEGPEATLKELTDLQTQIASFGDNDYPLAIDALTAQGILMLASEDTSAAGIVKFQEARDLAIRRYGSDHALVARISHKIARAQVLMNNSAEAIREFTEALRIAKAIYPAKAQEIGEFTKDLAMMLFKSDQLDESAVLLETMLKDYKLLPREVHGLSVSILGSIYGRQGKTADGRELLTSFIDVLKKQGADGVNTAEGAFALTELGKLELQQKNWQAAVDALLVATQVNQKLDIAASFDASEVHRLLSSAYEGLEDIDNARAQLKKTLEIYKGLGGADSPQAKQLQAKLEAMGPEPSPVEGIVANYFNFTPEGETMLVANDNCRVFADSSVDSSEIIGNVEAKAAVWSLEGQNGRHRIYLQEQKRFGWVAAKDVLLQHDLLLKKSADQLKELADKGESEKNDVFSIRSVFEISQATGFDGNPTEIKSVEEANELLKKHDLKNSYVSALLMGDLATMYAATGQRSKAFAAVDDQLYPLLSTVGYRHPLVAANRMKLGVEKRRLGDLNGEDSEFEEVLKICNYCFGPDDLRTQAQNLGFAGSLSRRGFFARAREIFEHQVEIEKDAASATITRASAEVGLSGLDASIGQHDSAAEHSEQALNALREMQFPIPDLTAGVGSVLAYSAGQLGEFQEAIDLIDRITTLAPAAGVEHRLALLVQKSTIASYADKSDAALQYATEADGLAKQEFGDEHFRRHDALQAMGRAVHRTKPAEAVVAYEEARRLALNYINNSISFEPADSQISFLQADDKWLDEALSLAMEPPSKDAGAADSGVAESTATWMLNFHNLLPRLLARDRQVRAELRTEYEYQGYVLWQAQREKQARLPLFSKSETVEFGIKAIEAEFDTKGQKYFADMPNEATKMLNQTLSWVVPADVQQTLKSDEVLVLIRELKPAYSIASNPFAPQPPATTTQRSYVAWIIPQQSDGVIQALELAKDSLELKKTIDAALSFVPEGDDALYIDDKNPMKLANEVSDALKKLGSDVWQPIADRLPSSTRRITLCLDGDLQRIPWEALPTNEDRTVLDDFTLRYLSSPRDLLQPAANKRFGPPVMMAESASGLRDGDIGQISREAQKLLSSRTKSSEHPFTDEARTFALEPAEFIPAGSEELEGVGPAFRAAFEIDVRAYADTHASEFQFFAERNPKALHVAAFSLVAPGASQKRDFGFTLSQSRMLLPRPRSNDPNPLTRCGLALTGFGIKGTKFHLEDGILSGEEIVTQDLRGTDLVTLSHGVVSIEDSLPPDASRLLPQAFQLAGAQSVLSPTWQVAESKAVVLLNAFYKNLAAGQSKSDALRTAQLELRKTLSEQNTEAHPFYWAAFRITGKD